MSVLCLDVCVVQQIIKMHQSMVILLLVLCASLSTDAQPANYWKFVRQHVQTGMTANMCNTMIGNRQIWNNDGCKPVNTFIDALDHHVRAVCTGGGQPLGNNLYRSLYQFDVVTCRYTRSTIQTGCQYNGFITRFTHIVLACINGWPVHFQRNE